MATVKSFIKKNADNLYVKKLSAFDGMIDGAADVVDDFKKVSPEQALGFQGVYVVGSSRNYISKYEDDTFEGFDIYNCCGSGILAKRKIIIDNAENAIEKSKEIINEITEIYN